MNERRKLTAIMFTDVAGYTAIMAQDELKAIGILQRNRALVTDCVKKHHGKFIKEIGDGTLSSFGSTLDAVNCSMVIQNRLRNDPSFKLRIGIHVGDVIENNNDIFGDGVNIAARLEQQAPVGGVSISETVYDAIRSHPEIRVTNLGAKRLKGTGRDINIYTVDRENFESLSLNNEHPRLTDADLEEAANRVVTDSNLPSKTLLKYLVTTTMIVALMLANVWYFSDRSEDAGQTHIRTAKSDLEHSFEIPSIAVLPFEVFSKDKDIDYISSGLTEEILNVLANIKELQVVARTSSFVYKGLHEDVRDIGKKLNANYVLEGSIRKSGDQIRVTAQLINTHDNFHLMSQNFDYELDNLFQFQDDISRQIVNKLRLILSPDSKVFLNSTQQPTADAYDQYLLGMSIISRNKTKESLERAVEAFEMAIKFAPHFAKAYSGLCRSYTAAHNYHASSESSLIDKAESACNKAKELDPTLIDIYVSLGSLYREKTDYHSSLDVLQLALRKNKHSVEALIEIGRTYRLLQNLEQSERYLTQAINLEPGNWNAYNQLGLAFLFLGTPEKAEYMFKKVLEIDPHNTGAFNNLGSLYLLQANFKKADSSFRRAIELDPKAATYSNRATALHFLGRFREAVELYQKAIDIGAADQMIWGNIADSYLQLGLDVRARECYLKAIELAEKSLKIAPKDYTTINMLAYYFGRVGELDKAEEYRALSLTNSTKDMYIYYYASLVSLMLGNDNTAIKDLENAVAFGYDKNFIAMAPELASLHKYPNFNKLIINNNRNQSK